MVVESARLLLVVYSFAVLNIVESTTLEMIPVLMREMRDMISGAFSSVASTSDKVKTDLSDRNEVVIWELGPPLPWRINSISHTVSRVSMSFL